MGLFNVIKNLEEYGLTLYNSKLVNSSDLVDVAEIAEDYADLTVLELMKKLVESADITDDSMKEIVKEATDTLTNIPAVGTLVAAARAVGTFHDAFLILKFVVFQNQFRKGKVSQEKLQKWRDAAKNHEKWIQREIELLLIRLDNISEKRNVEILCNVYLMYINGECTEEQFHEAAVLLERFVSFDEEQLKDFYQMYLAGNGNEPNKVVAVITKNTHCDRLVALGLLWAQYRPVSGGIDTTYAITDIGLVIGRALSELQ